MIPGISGRVAPIAKVLPGVRTFIPELPVAVLSSLDDACGTTGRLEHYKGKRATVRSTPCDIVLTGRATYNYEFSDLVAAILCRQGCD
jgi:hypothetical protein